MSVHTFISFLVHHNPKFISFSLFVFFIQRYAAQVCKNIRYSLLSPEYLMDRVAKEDVIRECRDCR